MQYSPAVEQHSDPNHIEEMFGLSPDVDNALFDLFVQDEELQASAARTHDDIEHMVTQLSGVDESHPAFEPLVEVVNSKVFLAEKGKPAFEAHSKHALYNYSESLKAVSDLNDQSLVPVQVALTLPAAACMVWLASLAAPAAAAVSTGVAVGAVANLSKHSISQIRDTRREIGRYLDFAADIHSCREDFDAVYAKLVLDEDQEQLAEV
jgi:hypothetical protein